MTFKKSSTPHTHDLFFKKAMSRPQVSKEFFELHLPDYIKNQIDLSTLKIEKESFHDNALGKGIVDMLFSVKFGEELGYLYLLSEHQSTPDYWMPYRIWKYMLRVCDTHLKKHPKSKKLPVVYPLIFYSGNTKYNTPLELWELFEKSDLMKEIFGEPFQLIELSKIADENLRKAIWAGSMEFIMKHIYEKDILPFIREFKELFQKIDQQDSSYIIDIVWYTTLKGESENDEEILNTFSELVNEKTKGKIMTIAERLIERGMEKGRMEGMQFGMEKGMEKGRMEGMEKGIKQIALNMLALGQDIGLISKITGLSFQQINELQQSSTKPN